MALTEKLVEIADAIRTMSGKEEKLNLAQMPGEILTLQGLNFEVTGNPQPAAPKENTIWVDTDTPVAGFVFAAQEPAGQEGMVWISTGVASAAQFNVLKDNCLMVYPVCAKQYTGGTWVDRTAKSYLNGVWMDWILYLYQGGSTFDSMTGGYVLTNAALEQDRIAMTLPGNGQTLARTGNPIDLSGVSTLLVQIDGLSSSGSYKVCLAVSGTAKSSITDTTGDMARKEYATTNGQSGVQVTLEVDVSGITGKGYVHIGAKSGTAGTKGSFSIRQIRGEA